MQIGRTAKKRAQSAMEYLMTYGWAILIIAVTLSVLFSLGLFNSSNINASACIASPGYLCSKAQYTHSTGNIIVTVGQNSANSWITANFVFVSSGTPFANGVPAISFNSFPANTVLSSTGGLSNGQGQATLYLPATGPVNVGTPISGTIYVQYTYDYYSGGVEQLQSGYAQIGTLNLKAT